MGIAFGGLAGAFGNAQRMATEDERKRKERADQQQTNSIQRAALLAGLQNAGISQQNTTGANALGDTGYFQDPSKTPSAIATASAAMKRQQRVGVLRRNPDLAQYGDDELAALADDDEMFGKYAAPKAPRKKTVMFDEKGKALIVDADDPQIPADFIGPHTERSPTAQQHVIDPVTGAVVFFDPTNPPKGLKVNPAPTPPSPMTSVGVDGNGHPVFVDPRNPSRSTTSTATVVPQKTNAPPTDAERLAAGFAARMASASQTLTAIEDKPGALEMLTGNYGSPSGSGNWPGMGNWTLSSEAQVYKQAQRNWVRANLRKESGAAIGDDEMAEEIRTYFPEPGDGKGVVAAKRRSRAIAEENMRRNAGNAMGGTGNPSTAKTSPTSGGGAFGDLIPKKTP